MFKEFKVSKVYKCLKVESKGCDRIFSFIPASRLLFVFCLLLFAFFLGCRQEMAEQPRYDPLELSTFFQDGQSARPLMPGTVARGHLKEDTHLYTGRSGRAFVDAFPFPITQEVLERGRERYDIFCAPCHGRLGNGDGMIVRRGFTPPPSFHSERLQKAKAGYYFDVITNGFGVMPDYATQIPVKDRWAIVSYIRALQLSQQATLADVPTEERDKLSGQ